MDKMIQSAAFKKTLNLFKSQELAVLATISENRPYCNLVAFAETSDCKSLIFATKRNTSKYQNLLKNQLVSLLIDDRTNIEVENDSKVAITAMGLAEEISPDEMPGLVELFISKQPALSDFVKGADVALFKVRISDYIIAGFESVERLHVEDILR
jgi:uncharacterized pyridoxamine 5'-phosphate oxidase family protein